MAKTKEELAEEARRKLLASDTPEGKAARAEEAAVKAATESYGAPNRGRPLKEYGRVTYPDDPAKQSTAPTQVAPAQTNNASDAVQKTVKDVAKAGAVEGAKTVRDVAIEGGKAIADTAVAVGGKIGEGLQAGAQYLDGVSENTSGLDLSKNVVKAATNAGQLANPLGVATNSILDIEVGGKDQPAVGNVPNEFDKAEDFLKKARGRDRGMSEEVGNVMADVELAKAETGYGRDSSAADPVAAIPAAGSAAAAAAAAGGDTPPDPSKGEPLTVNGVLSTTTNKYFSEKPEAQDSNNEAPKFDASKLVTKNAQGNYVQDSDPQNIMIAQRGFNRNQRDMELRDRTDKRKDFAATLDAANYDPSTASSEDKAEFYAQGKELGLSSQQIDKYANDQLTNNAKRAAERTALSTRSGGAQGSSGGVSTEQSRKGVQGASSQVQDSASRVSEYSAGRGSSLRQESKRISKNPTPRERRAAAAAAAKAEEEEKKKTRNT